MLESLSPQQRQLLMIGAPVVAVFALVQVIGKKNTANAVPTGYTLPQIADTGVIDTGQLASFESGVTSAIQYQANQLSSLTQAVSNIPAPVNTTVVQQPQQSILPPIDSAAFPLVGEPGSSFIVIGQAKGGGNYFGQQVAAGAPVYAKVNGRWEQNFNWNALTDGTPIATPGQFSSYVSGGTSHAHFG